MMLTRRVLVRVHRRDHSLTTWSLRPCVFLCLTKSTLVQPADKWLTLVKGAALAWLSGVHLFYSFGFDVLDYKAWCAAARHVLADWEWFTDTRPDMIYENMVAIHAPEKRRNSPARARCTPTRHMKSFRPDSFAQMLKIYQVTPTARCWARCMTSA
jgi:hypothetical protein